MNRLALTIGLAAMDLGWIYPWSVLLGLWTSSAGGPDPARPLLGWPSVFALVLLGALATQTLGRRVPGRRAAGLGLTCLGLAAVLVAERVDQYPAAPGAAWLASLARALVLALGEPTAPALAFALGLFLWWRGAKLGTESLSYADAESGFRWGLGWLIVFGLVTGLTRTSQLAVLEAETTPFVVGFVFVSLLSLALGRLESLRSRTRVLAVNSQWLGVLVGVAGLVILLALLIGQLMSLDLLILATRPLFDLLGEVVLVALYIVIIPLAYLVEWVVYLFMRLLGTDPNQLQPKLPQASDVDSQLQHVASQALSPELIFALKAVGAGLVLIVALLIVARAASRWRPSSDEADATGEERDSVWNANRLMARLLAWLRGRLRGRPAGDPATVTSSTPGGVANAALAPESVRALYRRVLALGELAGAHRSAATTPLEHLAALNQSLAPAEGVSVLTAAYVRVRYAESEPSSAEVEALRVEVAEVHARDAND